MLTNDEKDYLSKIPLQKKVKIRPFHQRIKDISNKLIKNIKAKYPDLKILHMGASGLGISGQGDIDIYAFSSPIDFPKYLPGIKNILGKPKSHKPDSVAWEFNQDGYDIEFYLTNPESGPMKRQMAVFKKLKQNKELLSKYEKLKEGMDGKSFKEYQKKKYEFYHRILGNKF